MQNCRKKWDKIIEFALKYIEDDYILIEMEKNEQFNTTEKLKNIMDSLNLPIEKNNYFEKKADSILNKILKSK